MSFIPATSLSQIENNPFLSSYPKDFWDDLTQSNQQAQTRNAPCALVLQAEYDDHRKSIRGAASQHLILQLAKTHRVAVKTVGNGVLVGKIINEKA